MVNRGHKIGPLSLPQTHCPRIIMAVFQHHRASVVFTLEFLWTEEVSFLSLERGSNFMTGSWGHSLTVRWQGESVSCSEGVKIEFRSKPRLNGSEQGFGRGLPVHRASDPGASTEQYPVYYSSYNTRISRNKSEFPPLSNHIVHHSPEPSLHRIDHHTLPIKAIN